MEQLRHASVRSLGVLHGRSALVTGAASGIGKGIATLFARQGANVLAVDTNEQGLVELAQNDHAIIPLCQDISTTACPAVLVAAAEQAFGGLDILANNAGIGGAYGPLEDCTDENWDRVFAVNVHPAFRITRAMVPLLKRSSCGRIIFTGSICGNYAIQNLGAYAASKHAIQGVMRAWALELGIYGITSNALVPGNTVTGATKDLYPDPTTQAGASFLAQSNVLGRYSFPDDVAAAALYLASDAASYVTGHSLVIDGGMTVKMPSLPAAPK